ncbi:hypothetical protein [Streptomyces minutiscleroticus]|uniref:Uncharacterized protein n=1 Tax=Streptomyces minutiscleroticus TaxID=68238 RepID=A0A918KR98_9ACTN|nr:hypothetical protein [Streptomyces minutiscleroticus]GGX72831.1 hypothetical protein GCM10010358_28900 [Streptomyces minutiscleroticus]
MTEILLALAYPVVVSASGIAGGAHCLWRRHRARRGHHDPHVYPGSARHHADLAARTARDEAVVRHAGRIVAAELGRVGDLYETPDARSAGRTA